MTKIRISIVAAIVGLLGITAMTVAPKAEAETISVCVTLQLIGLEPICIRV